MSHDFIAKCHRDIPYVKMHRIFFLMSVAIFAASSPALGNEIWSTSPVANDWRNPANWQGGALPGATDLAVFGSTATPTIALDGHYDDIHGHPGGIGSASVKGLEFSVGAPAYTILITGLSGGDNGSLTLSNGIIDNSANAPTIQLRSNTPSRTAILDFTGTGTAADSSLVIDGNGSILFEGRTDAGPAASIVVNNLPGSSIAAPSEVRFDSTTGPGNDGKVSVGSLSGNGSVVLGNNILTVGALNTSTEFDGSISGNGLVKIGSGTLVLGGTFDPTGAVEVRAGVLDLATGASLGIGNLGAGTIVNGGILKGTGQAGNVAVNNGGTIAPGHSIGTLHTASVTFAPGSTYQVEVNDAGAADLIASGGTVTLNGGTVQVLPDAGSYASITTYRIVDAAGGVTGSFAGAASSVSTLAPSLIYGPNTVDLRLQRIDLQFGSYGTMPNQVAVGAAVTAGGPGSVLYNALAVAALKPSAVPEALTQLSGEIHASARTALVEDSRFVRETALDRLQGPNIASPEVWGQGFGGWGANDGNGNTATTDRSVKGIIGGVDIPVYDWRVGLMGGFSDTDLNVRERSSTSTGSSYHLGLFGGTQAGPFAVRLGAVYSWHKLQTGRDVAFDSFSEQLTAHYHGNTKQAFVEAGYKLDAYSVSFEPFANFAYVNLNMGAFQEMGGAAALSAAHNATDTGLTTLGVHALKQVDLSSDAVLTVKANLGWRHAFGDVAPISTMAFAGSGGFAIDGVPIAQDTAAIDVGFDAAISEHFTISLSYTGEYAASARDNGFKANVGWKL